MGLGGERDTLMVDRAIAEMRAGRPILVQGGEGLALVVPAELLNSSLLESLDALAAGKARLALPPARLRRLGATGRAVAGVVALPVIDMARIEQLVLKVDGRLDAPVAPAGATTSARWSWPRSRSSFPRWSSCRSPPSRSPASR